MMSGAGRSGAGCGAGVCASGSSAAGVVVMVVVVAEAGSTVVVTASGAGGGCGGVYSPFPASGADDLVIRVSWDEKAEMCRLCTEQKFPFCVMFKC